ncbi:hypothetical protein K490DRAFT_47833 [Saccharata proteae CBS 121410]|uniref:2EXR domain-containing protein n=1 Tax=Saccharata proteae CBS 121410 TaxID=1314787 RepID=A0A9P4HNM7_9PEZI|nr:hypothetical protein K490DRAFT_47833 [Saccharata proteae CBS 121410]
MAAEPSPFLRLPTEIRLMIYELLLCPYSSTTSTSNTNVTAPDYHVYEPGSSNPASTSPHTLSIRTMDPVALSNLASSPTSPIQRRSTYHIRCDRFRARTMTSTYTLLSNPGLHPQILGACRQTHAEASELLYSSYLFDFDTHIEALVPFLADKTPHARSRVSKIRLVKRALPYVKEFDRAEWRAACAYLARNVPVPQLQLSLGVVAGKPGPDGWDTVPDLTTEHFRLVQPRFQLLRTPNAVTETGGLGLKALAGVDFEWVEQLLWLRGARSLDVKAIVEHCPPPGSDMMAFWVSFSKSVEGAFGEWLGGLMVGG